jgi:hypothetical protein
MFAGRSAGGVCGCHIDNSSCLGVWGCATAWDAVHTMVEVKHGNL